MSAVSRGIADPNLSAERVIGSLEPNPSLQVFDLGGMAYGPAYELQRAVQASVIAGRERGGPTQVLLLVEHDPPVITVSRRRSAMNHLLATQDALAQQGIEVEHTDRGGDITYHGPGQLVVYPIIDLNSLGLRLHGYMRRLEEVVLRTLNTFGIDGERDDTATGVWVPIEKGPASSAPAVGNAKICAMGVRVSRWVSMHGLALNVTTNLEHFGLIVPCGLVGRPVTSMQQLLGERCPSMEAVKNELVTQFETLFFHAPERASSH